MVLPASFRGDGGLRAESSRQHRRTQSATGDFHDGFVKRLASILDDHTKVIKSNADFLKEVSSTLRSHSYSSLPRPVPTSRHVSEPSFNSAAINIPGQTDTTAAAVTAESSPGFLPPTPPDTPIVEITDWSCLPEKSTTSTMFSMPPPESVNGTGFKPDTPASLDRDITTWYNFHASRAAKSLRFECREVDLKLSQFIRRMNDQVGELKAISSDTTLNPNFIYKDRAIRRVVKEEFESIRQTLHHYRKSRAHPLYLATTKSEDVMPGFTTMNHDDKIRALHEFYSRNKDISRPGDRKKYNETMEVLDACISKDLNEEFVQKIDNWDRQVEVMRSERASDCVV